ncbi:ferritin [Labilibacter marinus]|uniref:ferritin n=1 Tax=Labilibacter marinus TaxID=1477105 RepID=UPI000833B6C0|nr:ferritin [Labilibacter marinus]
MLKKTVEEILVRQIEREAYSSNLYLSMASWAETNGLGGVSEWMYSQAEEEKMHLLKFMKYVNERGGKAVIPAVAQPPAEFKNVQDIFEQTLEHERFVTESINEIVGVCLEEKDFTTHNWIQWFVTEQIEEEASVSGIIDKLKLLDGHNLYMFDRDVVGMRGAIPGSQQ